VESPRAAAVSPEHLAISPAAAPGNAATLDFDWEPMVLGTNRSCMCTVTTDEDQALSVMLEQGTYRRSFDGTGSARVAVIPPAPLGTAGTLTARNVVTGASATYTWQWQSIQTAPAPAPTLPQPAKSGSLLSRLFGRTKSAEAPALAKAAPATLSKTVAERLGARAGLAVSLKLFGQVAQGQRFAFILDRSGSMRGKRWTACTQQLEKALRALPPHVEFVVVLFSNSKIEPPGQTDWRKADRSTVDSVIEWVGRIPPGGGTIPNDAFQRVFSLASPPDVIYFLTDGALDYFGVSHFVALRGNAATVVHTIGLESAASVKTLTEIASASGGQFILIPDAGASHG
jgi:hypothetical protein